ncbi:MAG: hypothetical protein ABR571_02750 [Jatrophihabitans sp.]|uniref:hypothetical protein n=1 Tax=Jatrophihabitans sp. TaxID=1932789 RepID=UPI003911C203
MFIQVFQGKVADEAAARRTLERWRDELMPGATGFLGSTTGVATDGTLIGVARFDSRDAAMANSGRPEQDVWWAEMEKSFDGDVTFMECEDARAVLGGGSDDAHFVQVMEGRSDDLARMRQIMTSHEDELHAGRPEVLGGVLMDAGDGRYVNVFYFASEAEARTGEQLDYPEEIRAEIEEGMALMGEVSYFDLREPLLISP